MKVGCVKEIKNNEFRVGMTPDNVKSYVAAGHEVYIEKGAGVGSGFQDAEYEAAGAKMIDTAKEVWDTVEMMIKVKEPLPEEYPLFHEGLILYTYLHLAADKPQTDALLNGKVKGVKLVDLKPTSCRWPEGDPKDPDFHFCGKEALPGKSYCEEHSQVAYSGVFKAR